MNGVRFTKPMAPYSAGDTAAVPKALADKLVKEGCAEHYDFGANPHGAQPVKRQQVAAVTKPMVPAGEAGNGVQGRSDRQTYRTKGN